MDRRGAERARHRQALLDRVDREDLDGAAGQRRLHGAEADRAEAEDGDRVAGPHPGVGDRVVAGAHHVAGEERHLVGHPLGHPAQGQVGARHEQLLGLGALQVAEVGAVAEGLAVLAAVVVAAQAGGAGRAGGVEAAQHAVADRDPLDVVAGGEHRADELVADREALLDRHPAVEDVQVGAADPARLDPDQRVVSGGQLGIGLLLDPDLAGSLEGDSAHRAEPYRPGRWADVRRCASV